MFIILCSFLPALGRLQLLLPGSALAPLLGQVCMCSERHTWVITSLLGTMFALFQFLEAVPLSQARCANLDMELRCGASHSAQAQEPRRSQSPWMKKQNTANSTQLQRQNWFSKRSVVEGGWLQTLTAENSNVDHQKLIY